MAQRRKERPLWEAGRKARRPQGPSVQLSRRAERRLVEAARQQALTGKTSGVPPGQSIAARTGAWRFRFHLVPGLWALVTFTGLAGHYAHLRWWWVAAGTVTGITWIASQGKDRRTLVLALLSTLSALMWALVMGHSGLAKPWPAVSAACWLLLSWLWWDHYRWRLPRAEKEPEGPDTSVQDKFAALAAKRKWSAALGDPVPVPGGEKYPILCNGAETHIGEVLSQPNAIAATYGTSITRVYAEEHPAGDQDKGELFMMCKATLEDTKLWSGRGVDPRTGMARVGRWPDEKVVCERVISFPQDGVKHCIVAGADGSGKSGLLNQGIANSAITGWIAPVILDPQEGQALPAWRDVVPYACGADQCLIWLLALEKALLDRSKYLASLTWINPENGKHRKGMGFFNPFTKIVDPVTGRIRPLGLPVVEITIDEAPLLLALTGAKDLLLNILKLGRKAGVRVRLACQVPSLTELGGDQALRSLLVGGSVFCLRTGDKVSGHMTNISAAPWQLPKIFPSGEQTFGLGYADTLGERPNTPFRADWLKDPYEVSETAVIAGLDDRFAAKMQEIITQQDATVEKLGAEADTVARLQALILAQLPATQGQLVARLKDSYRLTEVAAAISELTSSGRAVNRRGKIEAS
jgi:hypothetical protein